MSPVITDTPSPSITEELTTTTSSPVISTSPSPAITEEVTTTTSSPDITTTPSSFDNTISTNNLAPSPSSSSRNNITTTITPSLEENINSNVSNITTKNNLRGNKKNINSNLDGGSIATIVISILLLLIMVLIIIYKHKNRILNKIKPIVYPEQIKVKIVKEKNLDSKQKDDKTTKQTEVPKVRRKSYKVAPIKNLPPINNKRITKIKRLSTFAGNKLDKKTIPSIKRSNSVVVNSKINNKKEKIDGLDNTLIQCSEYLLEDIERESKKLWGKDYHIPSDNKHNLSTNNNKNFKHKKEEELEIVYITNNHKKEKMPVLHENIIEKEAEPVLKIKKKLKTITKQEESKNEKIIKLEKIVNDMSNGIVSRMKAKNELAQIRSKDTLPLRRDKINQQAALRKMQNINKITNISNKKGKELNHPQHFKKIKTVNTLIHVSNKNVDNTAEIKSNINNNLNRSNSINEILSKSEDILKSIEEEGLLN